MMRDDTLVAQVLEIAASGLPLLDRARAVVEALQCWLPADAVWLTLSDPRAEVYAAVGSGLTRPALDHLDRPGLAGEIQRAVLDRLGAADRLPTWVQGHLPAGLHAGLGVPLCEPGGPCLGMFSLLFAGREEPSIALHQRVRQLAPLIARVVSPVWSVVAAARLVEGATSGVVLLRDGGSWRLPGLDDHQLLLGRSVVVSIGRQSLVGGHVHRSFLWPVADPGGDGGHARVTVLAARDAPAFVLGTVLVTPQADCRGLTPRELEVLGLLVEGRSNQQIASVLTVAPRTVATHVEHILDKLQASTRTVAAVRAEREGCHVPPAPAAAAGRAW